MAVPSERAVFPYELASASAQPKRRRDPWAWKRPSRSAGTGFVKPLSWVA